MDEKKTAKAPVQEPIMHDLQSQKSPIPMMKVVVLLVVVALLGVGTGFALAQSGVGSPGAERSTGGKVEKGKTYGSNDTKTFKDTTEGVLKEGGVDGEGQYHLERPGGISQNVYLTSSYLDLSEFMGKKVKVWGETQKAQKAGWLMDVGRVQVL